MVVFVGVCLCVVVFFVLISEVFADCESVFLPLEGAFSCSQEWHGRCRVGCVFNCESGDGVIIEEGEES